MSYTFNEAAVPCGLPFTRCAATGIHQHSRAHASSFSRDKTRRNAENLGS